MNSETDKATELVKAGAEALDKRCPCWWRKINLDKLDMSHFERCVLAQAYSGSYMDGTKDLQILFDTPKQRAMGFERSEDAAYDMLQAAWVDLINERRKELQ